MYTDRKKICPKIIKWNRLPVLKSLLKLESVGDSLIVFGNPTRPSENEDTFILKPTVKVE